MKNEKLDKLVKELAKTLTGHFGYCGLADSDRKAIINSGGHGTDFKLTIEDTTDEGAPTAPIADIEAAKDEIASVIAYAEAHPLSIADMVKCLADGGVRPGKIPQHCCTIPEGYLCVFTIEEQLPPLGLARHLSARQLDGRRPDEDQFIRIAEAFGFDRSRVAHMVTEDITDDNGEHAFAINILQSVNPPEETTKDDAEEEIPPAEKRF